MGQYHHVVNLDKKQYLDPHKLGCGLKLWEHLANHPGVGSALIILLASASNGAGGGDIRTESEVVGSWRGDRIAMVGDYDDESTYMVVENDGAVSYAKGSEIYGGEGWADITEAVCAVIESELDGKFVGDGWRQFVPNTPDDINNPFSRAMKPDMVFLTKR